MSCSWLVVIIQAVSSWHEHEPRAHKKLKLCNNGFNLSQFAIKINLQRLEDIRQTSQLTFNFLFWDLDKLCPAVFVATKTNILSQTIMFSKGHCSFWESLEIELLSHLVMRTCWSFYLCLLLFLLKNTYDGRTGGGLTCWQGTENQLFFTGIVRLHSLSSYITLWCIIRCFPRR